MNTIALLNSTIVINRLVTTKVIAPLPDLVWYKLNGNILDYSKDNLGKSMAKTTSEQYSTYLSKSCFLFDGGPYATGNFISLPAMSRPVTLTFSCFINITIINAFARIFDYGGSFRLHMKNSTSLWFNDKYKINYKGSFQNTWKHIAFTIDGNTLRPYENGLPMNAITMTSGLSPASSIGYIAHSMGGDPNTKGMFSDFRIYGRALGDSEMMNIFQSNA